MILETVIRTPQFKDGKVLDWTVQRGTISDITFIFEPKEHISGSVGKHGVTFRDKTDWEKYKVQ